MSQLSLAAPQLVVNSRMIYSSWIPADPRAAAALLPRGLQPAENHAVFMNQYVVDSAEQTSGFGAYSLTYLGADLAGFKAPDGATPARFFTHYLNSSDVMRSYVQERGVPARPGSTTVDVVDGVLTATTSIDDRPVIRTRARVSEAVGSVARGHLTYVSQMRRKLMAGNYAYIGEIAASFELLSLEFLVDEGHPLWPLRPAQPLQPVTDWCWFAPRDSFVYPGGEYELRVQAQRVAA
jgi:hypothetical protein